MECLSKTPYNIHLAMSAQFKLNPDLRSSNQKFRTCPALSLGLPQQLLVNTTGGKRYKRKRLLSSQGFKWLMCTQDPSAQSLTAVVKAQSGWSLSSEYTAHLTLFLSSLPLLLLRQESQPLLLILNGEREGKGGVETEIISSLYFSE